MAEGCVCPIGGFLLCAVAAYVFGVWMVAVFLGAKIKSPSDAGSDYRNA